VEHVLRKDVLHLARSSATRSRAGEREAHLVFGPGRLL
jgi:hypothetical protein